MPVKISGVVETEATAELRDRRVDPMTTLGLLQEGYFFFHPQHRRGDFFLQRAGPNRRTSTEDTESPGMRRILAGGT